MQDFYLSEIFFHQNHQNLEPAYGLDLDNVTFENFKSFVYGYYSRALAINYDPNSPRSFISICLKCNTARFQIRKLAAACDLNCYFYIFLFFGSAVIGFSCCGVPAQYYQCIVTFLSLVFAYLQCFFVVVVVVVSVFFRAKLIK